MYLPDTKACVKHSILRTGAVVAADNVIMGGITDYLHYVRTSPLFKESTLFKSFIEYSEPERAKFGDEAMKDGVEVTVFVGEKEEVSF